MQDARLERYFGSGKAAAPGHFGWLNLAAAPIFGLMAVWTVMSGGQPEMLCVSANAASPLSGMALMYILMTIFHAAPWLTLLSKMRIRAR